MTEKKRISVAEATPTQLRDFAELVYGLEIHPNANKQTIVARLAEAGYTLPDIPEIRAPSAPPAGMRTANSPVSERRRSDGRVEYGIRIEISDKPGGDRPVPVQCNGKLVWLPRGIAMWVPAEYVEILDHAVETSWPEYDPAFPERGMGEPRHSHSYPFSFVVCNDDSPGVSTMGSREQATATRREHAA